jgi:4-oxalocrotonate tautomerase
MPHIQVHAIKDVFTPAQKQEVIRKLTDTMVAIEGENMRPVTWVTFHEVASGDWGIGGKTLTTEAVHALQRGE